MAVFVPPMAAHLAKIAAKDVSRYAMTGIRVVDARNGTYRLEAMDGYRVMVLRGNSEKPNMIPPFHRVGNPALWALVPTQDWIDAFKLLPTYRSSGRETVLGIKLGDKAVSLATVQGQRIAQPLEGRYPNIDDVLPKRPALISFAVNPYLLIDLLQAACAVLGADRRVDIHYYGKNHPLGLSCCTSDHGGVFMDGLIMPVAQT